MVCTFLACAGCLLTTAPAGATEESAAYDAVVEANEAFSDGRYDEALAGYESAAQTLGESPELNYNRAAAHYKLQQYEPAANLLAKAALSPDPGLSRRARFNWGNCDYASAMAELATVIPQEPGGATGAPAETAQQPNLEAASAKLQSAIRHYRGTVEASSDVAPDEATDRAARENIERAQRLIDLLEELEQQQQQQQQDQQQDEDQQDQEDQEQQQQQQDQQNEQQDEEQQQDQPQPDQQEQDQSQESEDQQPQPQPDQQQEREMTPEQAEAMLQAVRDKEKQRREEKLQRARKQRVPVVKDW